MAEVDEAAGQETADLIAAAGGQALAAAADIARSESVAAVVQRARAVFGPVEVLINNAILCPAVPVAEMEVALWDQVLAVNLRGAFLTCRACLPDMLARRHGIILNLVSTDAMPGLAAYIASKQGLLGFTQSLAVEVSGQGVSVIAFGPGMVDTPGLRGVAPALAPRLGLSEAQFLSMPLHRAYPGLMPAEHAGVAAAYLLPAFIRPLARGGFKNKAGLGLGDWQQAAARLTSRAQARDGAGLRIEWGRLGPRLERLSVYFAEVPRETARFTRDPDLLQRVAATAQARVRLVTALRRALDGG